MSFVVYDVETTGLTKGFDQIVQFAAVLLNDQFEVSDRIEARCRLLPHIVPSPEALHVTEISIKDLTDPALASHLEMISSVRRKLENWCPSLFLGFNSISFDEEFLRQAFYQCLFDPYLTNTRQSARADVLNLCRITAALRPEVLVPARDGDGRPIFKLAPLTAANGFPVINAHDAVADVAMTIALCRHIRGRAPEIWSQFLRFGQKATVEAFITNEDAFLYSQTIGNEHRAHVLMRFGQHSEQKNKHYCLNMGSDIAALRSLDTDSLIALFQTRDRPIITIRTNAAPTLWALGDATQEQLAPFTEDQILELVSRMRADEAFIQKLSTAAEAAETIYPPSPHVEDQIYDRREVSFDDASRLRRFHELAWPERAALASQFQDDRYRRLARRLIYFEQPALLSEKAQNAMLTEINLRLSSSAEGKTRWRSIPQALREIQDLSQKEPSKEAQSDRSEFESFLRSWNSLIVI